MAFDICVVANLPMAVMTSLSNSCAFYELCPEHLQRQCSVLAMLINSAPGGGIRCSARRIEVLGHTFASHGALPTLPSHRTANICIAAVLLNSCTEAAHPIVTVMCLERMPGNNCEHFFSGFTRTQINKTINTINITQLHTINNCPILPEMDLFQPRALTVETIIAFQITLSHTVIELTFSKSNLIVLMQ